MKLKYSFAFTLILAALFLLGSVAASDNASYDANSSYLSIDNVENQDVELFVDENVIANAEDDLAKDNQIKSSSSDEADLSVDMELGDVKKSTYGINEMSFEVPLILNAKAVDGTARNAKVYLDIPDDFEFISCNESHGSYNPESRIWNIGDLKSGAGATLTILTKINTKGTFAIFVNATTDSNDTDLSNNCLKCDIEVTSKISSNTTRTSAQQNEAQHNSHYGSIAQGGGRQIDWDNMPQPEENNPSGGGDEGDKGGEKKEDEGKGDEKKGDEGKGDEKKGDEGKGDDKKGDEGKGDEGKGDEGKGDEGKGDEGKGDEGKDNGEGNDGGNDNGGADNSENSLTGSISKYLNSNVLTNAVNSISNAINSIFNPDSSSDNKNSSNAKTVKAINTYDYRTIPILIFALFLILLVCNFGYEKIKS